MKDYIEKEIKLRIDNPFDLIDLLRRKGAIYTGGVIERTVRLDTEDLAFENEGKFIRVRSGFSNILTLKEKLEEDTNIRSRKETEFEIEDIEKAIYVLNKLGLTFTRKMEKYRQSWKYKQVKIELDELPFGIFIELEGSEEEIKDVCSELNLNTNKKLLETYWELHEKESKSKDIVFDKNHDFKLIN